MTDAEQGSRSPVTGDADALRAWLERQGVETLTLAELLREARPYLSLGYRPNAYEGLRFLATALAALQKEST